MWTARAAYAARWVAKSLVKAGLCRRVLVQVGGTPPCLNHHTCPQEGHIGLAEGPHSPQRTRLCAMLGFVATVLQPMEWIAEASGSRARGGNCSCDVAGVSRQMRAGGRESVLGRACVASTASP